MNLKKAKLLRRWCREFSQFEEIGYAYIPRKKIVNEKGEQVGLIVQVICTGKRWEYKQAKKLVRENRDYWNVIRQDLGLSLYGANRKEATV